MIDALAALEGTWLAQFLRQSRWVYPAVNAGHILGIALLVGAVVPMDLRLLGIQRGVPLAAAVKLLRPMAAFGLALAIATGALLFIVQARDYARLDLMWIKLALVALATGNAVLHSRLALAILPARRRCAAALVSLTLWPTVLVCGRMIGYL